MAKKGVTAVTDGIRDGWKTSCRGDVFVPHELVPFESQLNGRVIFNSIFNKNT